MPTTTLDEKLVRHGSRATPLVLVEQSDVTFRIALEHREKLLEAGLDPAWYDRTRELIAQVSLARGTQAATREEAKSSTREEQRARTRCTSLIRQLKVAAQIVLRDGPVAEVRLSSFMLGPVGRTTSGIMDYLARMRPSVVKLDEPLERYFKGQSPTGLLDLAVDDLRAVAGAQEARRANAPLETLALYQTQGELLRQLKQLSLVARIAFDDDPSLLALFNKSILMRNRGRRRKKADPTADGETPA